MKKNNGIFITFEGIDGCGKSTQARWLNANLKKAGHEVVFLREPGGTPLSERVRNVLLNRRLEISPVAELLLYEAARAQLAETIIRPALAEGRIVVCDRYFDSTVAYQGYGRKLDRRLIDRLNALASFGITPDITFIFDVDYKTSLSRRGKRPDRLEKEKQAFFNRVRKGFVELASKRRIVLLDGRQDIKTLFEIVRQRAEKLIAQSRDNHAR
ncbi:MAG: dTMP kinase [FCB group bacterium]|nr:dTMP kinase [FCB group bacterium]